MFVVAVSEFPAGPASAEASASETAPAEAASEAPAPESAVEGAGHGRESSEARAVVERFVV